jgi:NDP-sugar pyrophosphorylase family protein
MQAVILAGGEGVRLRPLTHKVPKPMAPVQGRPFLEILIDTLRSRGFDDFIICTGYLGEQIESHFGDGSRLGVRIRYSPEKNPPDTGNAVRSVEGMVDEVFFVFNGDTYMDMDFRRVYEQFVLSRKIGMVVAYDNSNPFLADNNLRIEGGAVLEYVKDNPHRKMTHVDAGTQVYRRGVFGFFPQKEAVSLERDVFTEVIRKGEMAGFPTSARYFDIGSPERLGVFREFVSGQDE